MAVTVTELRGERSADVADGKASAERVFQVIYDTLAESDPVLAITANSGSMAIPAEGAVHPHDSSLRVKSISVRPYPETDRAFQVNVKYEQTEVTPEETTGGGQTETELPTIQGRSVQRTDAVEVDIHGNAIVNSAGDPFDPPPEVERSTDTITVRGSVPFDASIPLTLRLYRDTLDKDGLFGYQPFSLKLSESGWATRRVSKTQVKLDIELTWYQKDDWRLELVDNGICKVDAGGGTTYVYNSGDNAQPDTKKATNVSAATRRRIADADGLPVNKPVLLDGAGGPLLNGPPVIMGPFQMYEARSHSDLLNALGLPTTLDGYTVIPS